MKGCRLQTDRGRPAGQVQVIFGRKRPSLEVFVRSTLCLPSHAPEIGERERERLAAHALPAYCSPCALAAPYSTKPASPARHRSHSQPQSHLHHHGLLTQLYPCTSLLPHALDASLLNNTDTVPTTAFRLYLFSPYTHIQLASCQQQTMLSNSFSYLLFLTSF